MANPYFPHIEDLGGTAVVFDASLARHAPGVTTIIDTPQLEQVTTRYACGARGVTSSSDPDLAGAINALAFNDIARWPHEGGSTIPLPLHGCESVELAVIVNYMGRAVGHITGIPEYPEPFDGLAGTSDATHTYVVEPPNAGTVPYINPAGVTDPDLAYAVNYLLDDSDYSL